ncbi:RelB protein [Streptococcus sobrinus]|nr:RelB protein [Streptococcus sobrinus]
MCYKRRSMMSTVTVRLNKDEEDFFKTYAQITGVSLSTLFKKSLEKAIEDEYDLKLYQEAYRAYQEDPETLSHADFKKELGF